MRKIYFLAIAAVLMWKTGATAQTAVYEYKMDTSIYWSTSSYFCPSPDAVGLIRGDDVMSGNNTKYFAGAIALFSYQKKNSNQYDIFSFTGKIASVTIPLQGGMIFFSQYFIDNDADWECIVNYRTEESVMCFKVFDTDGATLLSDTGYVYYGYDWQNTYVVRMPTWELSFKAWRFRTNVSSIQPGGLTKTSGSTPNAMMTFGPTGDYRISFEPAGGGRTTVQLFDMLGKQIFAKTIDDITRPMSFNIPESRVPCTPFIAKVSDGKGSTVRKEIPVR